MSPSIRLPPRRNSISASTGRMPNTIRGRRVLLVDDVISTGESIEAIRALVEKAGGIVAGKVCILTEGDPRTPRRGHFPWGNLPLFPVR